MPGKCKVRKDQNQSMTPKVSPQFKQIHALAQAEYGDDVISHFRGENYIFSNMYPLEENHDFRVSIDNMSFGTTEAAFMAAKTDDIALRRKIQAFKSGQQAKRFANKMEWRKDWYRVRFQVMEDVVRQKFQQPELKERLLATGSCYIMEGNTWGDTTWGKAVRNGELVGYNELGRILMRIRSELSPDASSSAWGAGKGSSLAKNTRPEPTEPTPDSWEDAADAAAAEPTAASK